jgi:hypothetical protein
MSTMDMSFDTMIIPFWYNDYVFLIQWLCLSDTMIMFFWYNDEIIIVSEDIINVSERHNHCTRKT